MMFKAKNKLKQRSKIILINIFFGILFVAIYILFIQAGLNELQALNQDINSNLNALKILEKKGEINRFKQSLLLADGIVGELSQYFIKDEVEFVTKIENTAAESGLTERLVMNSPRLEGKIKVTPITLYTQGTFRQQLLFIDRLGKIKYFLNIRSINLAKVNARDASDHRIDMTLNIDTYWQPNEK